MNKYDCSGCAKDHEPEDCPIKNAMEAKEDVLLYIEWCDAVANPNWFTEDEVIEWCNTGSEWVIRQCGLLVKETPKYICLASRLKEEDGNTEKQYGGIQKIPKTWILKRKIMGV